MPSYKLYRLFDYMCLFVTDCVNVSVCVVVVCVCVCVCVRLCVCVRVCVCVCLSLFILMYTMQHCSVYKCIMEAASLREIMASAMMFSDPEYEDITFLNITMDGAPYSIMSAAVSLDCSKSILATVILLSGSFYVIHYVYFIYDVDCLRVRVMYCLMDRHLTLCP